MEENLQKPLIFRALKQVWPTINRVINGTVYLILTVVRSIVKGAMQQMKGGFRE